MSLDRAKTDVVRFTQAGFAVDLVFTAPNAETANVRGLASKHRISVNPEDGLPINSPNIHVTVTEEVFTVANAAYPFRNSDNEMYLKGHRVLYDGRNYKVAENFPDETLKLNLCILSELE